MPVLLFWGLESEETSDRNPCLLRRFLDFPVRTGGDQWLAHWRRRDLMAPHYVGEIIKVAIAEPDRLIRRTFCPRCGDAQCRPG